MNVLPITQGRVAFLTYTIRDSHGDLVEHSGDEPFVYLHGEGSLPLKLENALEGKQEGDHLTLNLRAEEAYGEWDPSLIFTAPLMDYEKTEDLSLGMCIEGPDQKGELRTLRVERITKDEVTLDANHPLSGMDLVFEVEILKVAEASEVSNVKNCACGNCTLCEARFTHN